jgi:hypothetical protein
MTDPTPAQEPPQKADSEVVPPEKKADPKPPDPSEMTEPEKEKADLILFFESEMAPTPYKNLKATLTGKVGVKESLLNQLIYLREKKAEWGKK